LKLNEVSMTEAGEEAKAWQLSEPQYKDVRMWYFSLLQSMFGVRSLPGIALARLILKALEIFIDSQLHSHAK